jgi:hypothetical protein
VADGSDDYLVGDEGYSTAVDDGNDIFVIAATSGCITVADFDQGQDLLDFSFYGFDQNGHSAYWSASAVQDGYNTVMTLNGQNSEVVTVILNGVVYGHDLAQGDMIGGSADLIPDAPLYTTNGGNGLADVFVLDPQNGDITIAGFEDGLDRMDISGFINNGWDGWLSNDSAGSVQINFTDFNGGDFTVTLTGVGVPLIDASDYIF